RTSVSNTFFSLPTPAYDLSRHPLVAEADVIHLHWVATLLSPAGIAQLQRLGKPLVWTLHDQRAFTGGCHFSAACDHYQHECTPCPQLQRDPARLTAAILADSLATVEPGITVVCPSRWLADCAQKSALFRKFRIEVIPYGLDVARFRPSSRS